MNIILCWELHAMSRSPRRTQLCQLLPPQGGKVSLNWFMWSNLHLWHRKDSQEGQQMSESWSEMPLLISIWTTCGGFAKPLKVLQNQALDMELCKAPVYRELCKALLNRWLCIAPIYSWVSQSPLYIYSIFCKAHVHRVFAQLPF